ncbi:multidrug effflux MFS transporter [Streptomyces sp. XM4193]|uniref:multidrug effflux MFS transporter n=1 Tax=Streptomyces sp. XM4193 TaxID=2929782 RepID=UPI001FF7476B|nr:multidrug effflux MFS transporter [Streptomyces sp. XM4193]MCK1796159.1 multidrug effflux MFS transporter [Streptomyces sp. XM4193]
MTDSGPTPLATTSPEGSSDAAGRTDSRTPAESGAPVEAAPLARLTAPQRAGLLITLILGSLTALPALSMDMYLPALPEVSGELSSPAAQVQLTLTTCLLGLAVGQIIVGPMSDQFGRRRPLMVGMICYVVASVGCALAPTIETFTAVRLLQGLAGAAGIVIARAVVRDLFDGLAMARFFSTLLLISGIAPILAPVLGGQVLRFTNWRGIFVILAVIGVLLAIVAWRRLPETLPPERRHSGGVPSALRTMRALLRDRAFSGYLLVGSLGFAALFAYVAASPFVIQEIHGASAQTFSLLFMANSIGMVAVGQLNGKVLVGRVSLDRVLMVGLGVIGSAAVALLLMTSGVFGEVGLLPTSAGLFVLMSGMALVLPNANSLGLMRAGHAAGSASALLGTSQFLIGAIASPLVGVAGEHTAVPMAVVQVCTVGLAALCYLGMCRPWRSGS